MATIEEKINLAETINETMASPIWIYRLALVPGMEKAFLNEMASFKDVIYIRIVNQDGTIYKSNIESEWGETIKDPDIFTVARTGKEKIKNQIFKGEEIKVIIYPGYQNRTVWIGFSLKGVEGEVKWMWIRDLTVTWGGLLILILSLFLVIEHNIIAPVKEIVKVCEEVKKGHLNARIKISSKTEIGEFADIFNQTVERLKESKEALEESEMVLRVKVAARTRELRELAGNLEEKVKERTKELETRIKELEKFHKLTIGRELKMIELKKELKKMKKKLSKK